MEEVHWKDEIIECLKELGGIGSLDQILERVIARGRVKVGSRTPKKTISQTLQIHSLSTRYGTDHTFYSVYGVNSKKGIWGLVDFTLDNIGVDLTEDDCGYPEGRGSLRQHIARERNSTFSKKAKEKYKREHGRIFCEVCGFDFEQVYGELGKDYIEAHHIKPISAMMEGEKTKIEDLVMVCSNCHRMLHRKRPWISKEKLTELIRQS